MQVIIAQWPATGRRKLEEGTRIGAPTVYGENVHKWEGDLNICHNKAVDYGKFCSGRLPADVTSANRTHVLTRAANYHPDSGQVSDVTFTSFHLRDVICHSFILGVVSGQW